MHAYFKMPRLAVNVSQFSTSFFFGQRNVTNMLHTALTANIFPQIGHILSSSNHDGKERTLIYLIFTHLSCTFTFPQFSKPNLSLLHSPSLCSARPAVSPLSASVCYCELGEGKISGRANRWLTASCVSAGGPVAKFSPFQKYFCRASLVLTS